MFRLPISLPPTHAAALAGALFWALAPCATAAPRQDIIESPGHTEKIYLQSTDLMGAGRGWVWRMPLIVNALDPVLGIEVAGEPITIPYQARIELRPGVWLHEGENQVRVRAFTDTRVHERTFLVNVEPLEAMAALPGAVVNDQRILMFRPVEHGADILPPDALLEVGGGGAALYDERLKRPLRGALMFEFVIEVSAFSPIRWIAINGKVVSRPNETWAEARAPVLVAPEGTVVEVQAATDLTSSTERFTLGLAATPIPGTRLYQAHPPGYVKPAPPAPGEEEMTIPAPAEPASQ